MLLTHGWLSNVDVWASGMADAIRNAIGSDANWDICAYDWREDADTGISDPWAAFVNALFHGERLGKELAKRNYEHIHFIAHSAGSNLIQTAADWIHVEALSPPRIHSTFLDAFDPRREMSHYGNRVDWAEQYVDMRPVVPLRRVLGQFDATDIQLPNAYNFDVTGLDSDDDNPHEWPREWYMGTIQDSLSFGFPLSVESGRSALLSHDFVTIEEPFYPRGNICDLSNSAVQDLNDWPSTRVDYRRHIVLDDPPFNFTLAQAEGRITTSETGTIFSPTPTSVTLATASPVWISIRFEVTEPINIFQFAYQFTLDAEGLLSVFFDNQLVFRTDERLQSGGVHVTDAIWIGETTEGQHILSFRLDNFVSIPSAIEIADVRSGFMSLVVENTPPIANAGPNQTVSVGSLVTLDGSGSSDPDNGPAPLSFTWTQVDGPAVTLTGADTATPTFTPTVAGTYTFSLVVNDGEADSAPDSVTITATSPCATDVSGQVSVTRGGFRLNRSTRRYVQQVTLQNTSGSPIQGPVSLVLDNLSSNATLYNATGNTDCATPVSPYVSINVDSNNVFNVGETASVVLEFENPSNQGISYNTRVLAGEER